VHVALDSRAATVERQAIVLQALEPARLLARGYAWVTSHDDGAAVRTAHSLQTGRTLRLTFADSSVEAVVAAEPVLAQAGPSA
jgi:exodeoxyribonuclease VII large subunit